MAGSIERAAETERNRRVARAFIEALASGEIELRDWLTEDVEFVVADADHPETSAAIPWVGFHEGIAGVEAFLEQFGRNFEVHGIPVDRVVADGPDVVVLGRFEFTTLSTRRHLTSPWVAHLRFEGDKIASYHFYENTFAVAWAFRTGGPWSVDNEGGPRELAD
jgi:uncharacterized protein